MRIETIFLDAFAVMLSIAANFRNLVQRISLKFSNLFKLDLFKLLSSFFVSLFLKLKLFEVIDLIKFSLVVSILTFFLLAFKWRLCVPAKFRNLF